MSTNPEDETARIDPASVIEPDARTTVDLDAARRDIERRIAAVRARFTYQPLRPGDAELYTAIGEPFRALAELLVRTCPNGRELSTALTCLAEARMHANAAIALHGTDGA